MNCGNGNAVRRWGIAVYECSIGNCSTVVEDRRSSDERLRACGVVTVGGSRVLPPEPPGTEPRSAMLVQATVRARKCDRRSTQLAFYLADDPARAAGNIPIASVTVPLLPAVFGETASIPQQVGPVSITCWLVREELRRQRGHPRFDLVRR